MLNDKSIIDVNNNKIGEFTLPLYNSYCFTNILGTIKNLFNIESEKSLPKDVIGIKEENDKVIFFLIDGFGWNFYEKFKNKSNLFNEISKAGIESKLTTQFPSSTSGQIATLLSNTTINEHGIVDWYYYEPIVDENIIAFLFKNTFEKGNENLKFLGHTPDEFLPKKSFFKELSDKEIKSIAFQPEAINGSTYSQYMFRDATLKGYTSYKDLYNKLSIELKVAGKKYFYIYLPQIDHVGHEYGSSSKHFEDEVTGCLDFLDMIYKDISNMEKTSILLSADHGQIEIDKGKTEYLNLKIKDIDKYLKRNKKGNIYSPCGYYRDVFLHAKEATKEELKKILQKELNGKALVFELEEAIKLNIFKEVEDSIKKKIGNIVIIPLKNNTVWFYEEGIFEVNIKGVHGGLSKEEMEIPFLYLYLK